MDRHSGLDQIRHHDGILTHVSTSNDVFPSPCSLCRQPACRIRSHQDYLRKWGRQRTQSQIARSVLRSTLHRGVHNERVNPFVAYPIVMNDRRQELYNQLFSRWNYSFNGPERHLFPFSRYAAILNGNLQDKALLLGLLSMVATQVAIIRDGTPDEFALRLQLDVVVAQREALSRNTSASDARIMTAMIILSNTVHTDKSADIGDLLGVVQTMLHQRGGIKYLGMDGVLADGLMYTDHLNALLRKELPGFTMPRPYLISRSLPERQAVYQCLYSRGLLSSESMMAARIFTILVQIYEMAAQGVCSGSNKTYFTYLSTAFEHQVCVANAQYHDTDTLDECLVLGLVIFDNTVFRNSRDLAPPVSIFEQRFWRTLRALREENFFQRHQIQSLEYYLVYLGTITSLRRPCPFQTEAIEVLAAIRKVNDNVVRNFDALTSIMNDYGWSKTACFVLCANIWLQSSERIVAMQEHDGQSRRSPQELN